MRKHVIIEEGTYFIKLNHIWVTDFLENLNFTRDALNVLFLLNTGFFQNFDCDLKVTQANELTSSFVRVWVASLTFPKVPLPRFLPNT